MATVAGRVYCAPPYLALEKPNPTTTHHDAGRRHQRLPSVDVKEILKMNRGVGNASTYCDGVCTHDSFPTGTAPCRSIFPSSTICRLVGHHLPLADVRLTVAASHSAVFQKCKRNCCFSFSVACWTYSLFPCSSSTGSILFKTLRVCVYSISAASSGCPGVMKIHGIV